MSFKNNPFDRFSYFDPESKLSEFRKNFFQNQNKMFADSNRWPNGVDSHLMTKNQKTDNNGFEGKDDGIPIKVFHEKSEDNSEPNDDRNHDSMSSFGSSQSQRSSDTSNSSGSGGVFHSNRNQDPNGGEPRVYHIPITVEPREGSTSSGYTSEANVSAEQPLSRSSSHSSGHSIGSAKSQNRSFSSAPHMNASEERKERQIPVKLENNDNLRTTSPPKESPPNVKNKETVSKSKPKSGPFVTRIPVVNPTVSSPEMKDSNPEVNTTPEPKTTIKDDPLERINEVLNDLKKYANEVNQFEGTANDMKYRVLDEMLTRCMIKLDTIETNGIEEVRRARKAAVLAVNQCIALLEHKCQPKLKTGEQKSTQSEEVMQISTPEPTEQQTKEEVIDPNQRESQTTDSSEKMDSNVENIQTIGLSPKQNDSQNQSSDNNKASESQRKETAV